MVELYMNYGVIKFEFDVVKVLKMVENFLNYVKKGYYDGIVFYCVINGFMIQGGGFELGLKQKLIDVLIDNEVNNGLKNDNYMIVMVCMNDLYLVIVQFFINVNDNDFLNYLLLMLQGWGYVVFGKVVEGQDVVDKIKGVKMGNVGFYQDVLIDDVVIEKVVVV